jgi:hypothetical protein
MNLPSIDLSTILPVVGLAAIAVLCGLALIVHGLLRSRIALLIAVVIGVVVTGPTLAGALVNVVWALVPLGVVAIAGIVTVMWLLNRNPELLSLARDVVPHRAETPAKPLELQAPPTGAVVINQPRETTATPQRSRTVVLRGDGDRWGF